jgi:hypothetical protein
MSSTCGADQRRWLVYQPGPTDLDGRRDEVLIGTERSVAVEVLFARISCVLVGEVDADEFVGVPESPYLVVVFHAVLLVGADAVVVAIPTRAVVAAAERRLA